MMKFGGVSSEMRAFVYLFLKWIIFNRRSQDGGMSSAVETSSQSHIYFSKYNMYNYS